MTMNDGGKNDRGHKCLDEGGDWEESAGYGAQGMIRTLNSVAGVPGSLWRWCACFRAQGCKMALSADVGRQGFSSTTSADV